MGSQCTLGQVQQGYWGALKSAEESHISKQWTCLNIPNIPATLPNDWEQPIHGWHGLSQHILMDLRLYRTQSIASWNWKDISKMYLMVIT